MAESCSLKVFTEWLGRYLNFERTPQKNIFWLDTMHFLCGRLGNPQLSSKSFHVAGSKGKGSVSTMIASILEEAGYTAGLYTSPHLVSFAERVGTAHGPFSETLYARAAERLMREVGSISKSEMPKGRPFTWFELVTAFAMVCFREARCDFSVYEVGLGGRLDATTVIEPSCCCIGPIELEHTEFLGNSLEAIASEKAGIIKSGVPVIVAAQKSDSVMEVFRRMAVERNAPLLSVKECANVYDVVYKNIQTNGRIRSQLSTNERSEMTVDGSCMSATLELSCCARPLHLTLGLVGEFQAWNAALAVLAVKTVMPDIPESVVEAGLSRARLPGRFELKRRVPGYPQIPSLVLDGAHTVASVQHTLDTFFAVPGLVTSAQKPHLLFACAADKAVEDIAPLFADRFQSVMLTRPGAEKASDINRLEAAFASSGIAYDLCEDCTSAIERSLSVANSCGMPILVTGSFYLVAEVQKFLNEKEPRSSGVAERPT